MKIAARKTDGAWFRTNAWLRNRADDFKARLKQDTDLLSAATDIFGVLGSLAGTQNLGGSGDPEAPASAAALLGYWIDNGFPRQVYMGKLSFDNYTKVLAGGNIPGTNRQTDANGGVTYWPENEQTMRTAGALIRKKLNRHRMVSRQMVDIANHNPDPHINPGGVANARKNSLDGDVL